MGKKRKYRAIQKLHEIKELHETVFCLKDKTSDRCINAKIPF
jgi:hypothetical protein